MTRTRWLLAAAVLAVLTVCGFLWVSARIDSYDRRYQECMKTRGAGHYFGDDAYNQAMAECEHGAPPSPTGNPASWSWP